MPLQDLKERVDTGHVVTEGQEMTLESVVDDEIKKYQSFLAREDDVSTLQWWADVSSRGTVPVLVLVASAYLSIQASSCAAERQFSRMGMLVNDLRAQMDAWTVFMIMFVHMNKDLTAYKKLWVEGI